ncbi:protein CHROMATIN REMODELING 4-like [Telopea speciosissima]|uniref:protein CHROMATIN REMODELING 4-like n=1 Tax=Telopea speciosissima TaxID=54955 RepID=UPI001CC646A2|nr:protein CHROMATIN REMODELING 4-like [Telopea speciosissima]
MQLSYGDLSSTLPQVQSKQFGAPNEHNTLLPPGKPDKFRPYFIGDFPVGPSNRPGTSSNLHSEHPFMLNSFANSSLSTHTVNCSSSCEFQQKEDEQGANKYSKLPSFLDRRTLNFLWDALITTCMHGSESTSTRCSKPDLPPTVLTIAHSVRLLYDEEKLTIPPFTEESEM